MTEDETAGESESAAVVSDAMAALGLAAYCWTLATDEIAWSANAAPLLEAAPETIRAGRHYAGLIDPASAANRYDAVMAGGTDTGSGVPFHIEYVFRPDGRSGERSLWVEDTAAGLPGPMGGRPASSARCEGSMRTTAASSS